MQRRAGRRGVGAGSPRRPVKRWLSEVGWLARAARRSGGNGDAMSMKGRRQASAPGDIDIQEILRRLPHRPPFLLVDRAEDFQPTSRWSASSA